MHFRPTRRGWIVLALTVLSFGFALLHPTMAPGLFAAGLAALVLASLAMTVFSLRNLQVHRGSNSDGAVDRPLDLPLVIENASRFPRLPVVIEEYLPFLDDQRHVAASITLPANSQQTVFRPLFPNRRGEYNLARVDLIGGDPAGLFRHRRQLNLPASLLIRPPSLPLSWLPLRLRQRINLSSTGSPIGVSGVGQEFFGLREYRQSDSFRFIHWRASARHNRLLVREFEENSAKQVSLFVDSEASAIAAPAPDDPNTNFELQVKAAATLANYLGGTHCNVLFSSGAMAPEQVRIDAAATQAPAVNYYLATLPPTERTMADQLADCFELILPHSILYCLTMAESPALHQQFDLLHSRGVEIRWLHAPREAFAPAKEQPTPPRPATGFPPITLDPEANLVRILANG